MCLQCWPRQAQGTREMAATCHPGIFRVLSLVITQVLYFAVKNGRSRDRRGGISGVFLSVTSARTGGISRCGAK